jgi:hypothetical protein
MNSKCNQYLGEYLVNLVMFFLFNLAHTHTAIAGTGFGVRKLHERVLNVA